MREGQLMASACSLDVAFRHTLGGMSNEPRLRGDCTHAVRRDESCGAVLSKEEVWAVLHIVAEPAEGI